jgi:hypothetical protein
MIMFYAGACGPRFQAGIGEGPLAEMPSIATRGADAPMYLIPRTGLGLCKAACREEQTGRLRLQSTSYVKRSSGLCLPFAPGRGAGIQPAGSKS